MGVQTEKKTTTIFPPVYNSRTHPSFFVYEEIVIYQSNGVIVSKCCFVPVENMLFLGHKNGL